MVFLWLGKTSALGTTDVTFPDTVKYSSQVLDAETGEPLAMVGVYVSNDNTTLTNFDGEFRIRAKADDVIRLTCVGRKTLYFRADRLPQTIRMAMLESTLSEVTVRSFEGIMLQISRQMEKAFKRRKKRSAQYFYRQTSVIAQQQDIVEAFINARSAVNLRQMAFLSGRHGKLTQQQWENPVIKRFMNLHHVLELGPMTLEAPFWNYLITPLIQQQSYLIRSNQKAYDRGNIAFYQKVYYIQVHEINEDDQQLYRIELQRREGSNIKLPLMTGTLYVDRPTLRVLSFDGQVENVSIVLQHSQLESALNFPVSLGFHIDYRYDHGYPEVADLSMQVEVDHLMTRTLLFNVDGQALIKPKKVGAKVQENMLTSIREAGYDSIFWANTEVVKRTAEEDKIANGTLDREQAIRDSIQAAYEALSPLERLADRLKRFGQAIPQEKVYVQMDNTCYFLSDTIWFAAYTRRTDTDRPSRLSRVLYVELLNHDGFLVERKLVEIQNGRGSGYFALPDTLYSGFFELRAYTRWQLNWGQIVHPHIADSENQFYNKEMARDYFRDYDKLYSRVFPVYDKPREAGEFVRDMTLRPLRRLFKKEATPPALTLSLFPEGGDLVSGVPCRVAFEAALQDGEIREGELCLICDRQTITKARTEHRGRGTFTFTPEAGKSYEAVFTAAADSAVVRQTLKDIQQGGVALQVERKGDEWFFSIQAQGTPDNLRLGMTIMHEGVTSHFVQIKNETSLNEASGKVERNIKNEELPAGVNQVTIFDEEGRVWADRLFFVTRPELSKPTLNVTGLKEQYEPYEEVTLSLQCSATQSPSLSLSVRDVNRQDHTFDSGNIMTEMLLSSEIKGFVPQPGYFFEADDAEHRRALDLLMLTQGWRRFRWQDMAIKGAWDITYPSEHTQIVTGSVNEYYVNDPFEDESEEEALDFQAFQQDPMKKRDSQSFSAAGSSNAVGQKEFDAIVAAGKSFSTPSHIEKKSTPKYQDMGALKREVTIHAEFVRPEGGRVVEGETMTEQGRFKIDLPRFYGDCVFFLTAADTSKWGKKHPLWTKKYKQHEWIKMEDDEYERIHEDAEFYVRLNFPYPRWVKPYTYYQTHQAALRNGGTESRLLTDGTQLLNEVTVRARRNRLRAIDFHKPVYVVDAYEAGNAAMDAGLITKLHQGEFSPDGSWGMGNTHEIAYAAITNYIGDMNLNRRFDTSLYYDSIKAEAHYPNQSPAHSYWSNEMIAPVDRRQYSRLEYIDKIYLYSDYSPRREGDERFENSNQPSVEVSLHRYPDKSRRVTYRDRRYILHGFAYQEDFYHPDYSKQRPKQPTDNRRTLYWNPELQLDKNGKATIRFWNNSRQTTLEVEVQGQSNDGTLLFK